MSISAVLWYVEIALRILLLARLAQWGLLRRYPVLSTLLGFTVARSVLLAYLSRAGTEGIFSHAYSVTYVHSQPVLWALYFILILELYSRMLEDFPGIRRLGRLVLLSALGAAGAVCGALIVFDKPTGFDPYPVLSYLVLQERSVFLCLGALTLLLLLFVAHYRLSIPRNVWVLVGCFGGYFLANAVLLTLRRYFGGGFIPIRNLVSPLLFLAAVAGTLVLFSKAGEVETRPIRKLWENPDPELEQALAMQLRGFNRALVKVLNQ